MSAKTEQQTTTQPASSISNRASMISHDFLNRIITVEAMVAQSPDAGGTFTISVPPVTLPLGTWTVNWDFVVTTPVLAAKILSFGIDLSKERPLPPRVSVVAGPAAVSPQRWAMQLRNDVADVNAVNYKVSITWQAGPHGPAHVATTIHDPTIAVVKDPIDPPPPPPTTNPTPP